MAQITNQIDLSHYDLNDPITKLMLMVNFNHHDPKLNLKNFKKILDQKPLLPATIKPTRQNQENIYTTSIPNLDWTQHQNLDVSRRLIYVTIKNMHRILKTPFDDHWSGQYLPQQNAVLLNYHDQKYYYVRNSQTRTVDITVEEQYDKPAIACEVYVCDKQARNQLIETILNDDSSYFERFNPNIEAFNALKNLWLAQTQNMELVFDDHKIKPDQVKMNNAFTEILETVLKTQSHQHSNLHLTYLDLINFYHEVQSHHLTSATQKVQTWLFNDERTTKSVNDMLKILKYYPNFAQLQNHVTKVDIKTDPALKKIFQQFNQDKHFPKPKKYNATVYQIDQVNEQVQPHQKHFLGVHGTQSMSIPTILCGGFKNHAQLQHDGNAQYRDTAQSLGDGTYFAKLDQASKALSYSNNQVAFLIVADVAYHNPVKTKYYDESVNADRQYDFVIADQVGISHGYNEYVAVNPQQQVTIKYLIEMRPTH